MTTFLRGPQHPLTKGLVMIALLIGLALFAQQLDPLAPVQAYTTADPNNPDRLGLATPDGRFSITPTQGCDWLASGQEVAIYPNWNLPPWLGIGAADSAPDCIVRVEGRMDLTPCFVNAEGACDVALEQAED